MICKLRAVEYAISLFFPFWFFHVFYSFVENVMKKLAFFNTNFQNLMKDLPLYKKSGSGNFWVSNGDS